jgi:hypothetical protein
MAIAFSKGNSEARSRVLIINKKAQAISVKQQHQSIN